MTRLVFGYVQGVPIVEVQVGCSSVRSRAFVLQGKVAPPLMRLRFLADSGSEVSAIDLAVAHGLGLRPVGYGPVNTSSTGKVPAVRNNYEISLQILDPDSSMPVYSIDCLEVVGIDLSAQNLDGILGRDVLNRGVAIFHGPKQSLMLEI